MSYDLYLLPHRPDEDPMDVLEQLEESETRATPEQQHLVERIGRALQEALPALEDNAGDATPEGEVHLMDPKGLEVSVYHHSAAVTFPYWDSLDPDALTRDIERVAAIVSEHTGWRMYDPQQEEWIEPASDPEGFRDAFDHGRNIVRDITAQDAAPQREPWWRRLLNRGS